MQYYKLGYICGVQTWIKTPYDKTKKQIKLYRKDESFDGMIQYGIGLY